MRIETPRCSIELTGINENSSQVSIEPVLNTQRHLFDIAPDVAYLNCAYMSPLMHKVVAAGHAGVSRKAQPWRISSDDFFSESEHARALFARLVGAHAEDIAIIPSASYGIALAANIVPIEKSSHIVTLADQFPSNVYAWREAAARQHAEVIAVPRVSGQTLTQTVLEHINHKTAVAALPYCHWTDGAVLDLQAISDRCKTTQTTLVLDLTQSLGASPFDAHAIDPDFVVCPAYKWLLGPYTLGFCYVAPRWHHARAFEHNWISRAGSENFSGLIEYTDQFQPGARRFDMGERAHFHLMPMATTALTQILEWSVPAIAQTLGAFTRNIAKRTEEFGFSALVPAARANHFLGLRYEATLPAGFLDKLAARGVHLSQRGETLRITPHLFNTADDIDKLCETLSDELGLRHNQ